MVDLWLYLLLQRQIHVKGLLIAAFFMCSISVLKSNFIAIIILQCFILIIVIVIYFFICFAVVVVVVVIVDAVACIIDSMQLLKNQIQIISFMHYTLSYYTIRYIVR